MVTEWSARLPLAWRISLISLAGYMAVPWPAAKLVLASAAAAAAVTSPGPAFPPAVRRAAWGACFALAFLILPYWLYFGGKQLAPPLQILWFAAMAAAGRLWAKALEAVTGDSRPLPPLTWWKAAAAAAALLCISWPAFFQVVPSRGDESQHILRLWEWLLFVRSLLQSWTGRLALGCFAATLVLVRKKWRIAAAAALGCAMGLWICAILLTASSVDMNWLPRYPGLQIWWQATALAYAPIKSWIAQEALYRVTPFLAVLGLALYAMRGPLAPCSAPIQLGAAFLIATAPAVRYYSTLLYLDLPLAAAMTIVCFEIEELAAFSRTGKIPGSAGWYALLLAGFLKETALIFIATSLLFCAWGRRRLTIAWAVGAPVALFLVSAGVQRGYAFRPANWATFSNYKILAGALWEQYGWLLLLAAIGVVLLAKERRVLLIAFGLAVGVAYTLFYLGDSAIVLQQGVWRPKYLGHARFMLAWLPALAAFSAQALRLLPPKIAWACAGIVLAGNLWVYPVSTMAAPNSHWGDYVYDTGDHFYPYNIAFERGRSEFPQARRVIVIGADFYYPYVFYQRKWSWPAQIDSIVLPTGYSEDAYRRSAAEAAARKPDLIWVHVMDHLPGAVYESAPSGYAPAGDYRSRFHRILAFRRP